MVLSHLSYDNYLFTYIAHTNSYLSYQYTNGFNYSLEVYLNVVINE